MEVEREKSERARERERERGGVSLTYKNYCMFVMIYSKGFHIEQVGNAGLRVFMEKSTAGTFKVKVTGQERGRGQVTLESDVIVKVFDCIPGKPTGKLKI